MPFLLFLRPFLPLIWRGLAVLAALGLAWWAWGHYVAGPYIAKGVAQEHVFTVAALKRAELAETANKTFEADLLALQNRYKEQGAQVAALVKKTAATQIAAKKVVAALATKLAEADNEIERLRVIASQPPAATKEQDCEDASQLIDRAAADRLRD